MTSHQDEEDPKLHISQRSNIKRQKATEHWWAVSHPSSIADQSPFFGFSVCYFLFSLSKLALDDVGERMIGQTSKHLSKTSGANTCDMSRDETNEQQVV